MSQQVDKLKKKAAEFEAKRQVDKAISTYLDLFKLWDAGKEGPPDVALYNRVGDMLIRAGNIGDAMTVWEKAVDYYGDGGFQNNAIALCNKILRHSPGRTSIYYKLGKMSAQKGFKGEAKKNYLEYADRMQKSNQIDEAFRALKEFADLCPDEDDIRQALADQFVKLGRKDEAIEQLQYLYERYESLGNSEAAATTVERMRGIDPAVEPKRSGTAGKRATSGLVFLDVDEPSPGGPVKPPPRKSMLTTPPPKPADFPPRRGPKAAIEGLPLIDMDDDTPAAPPPPKRVTTPVAPPIEIEPTIVELPVAETAAIEPLAIETNIVEGAAEDAAAIDAASADIAPLETTDAEMRAGADLGTADGLIVEPTIEATAASASDAPSILDSADIVQPLADLPLIELPQDEPPVPVSLPDPEPTPAEVAPTPTPVEALPIISMPIEATPIEATPIVADVSFGASFGTDEGDPATLPTLPEADPAALFGIDAVTAGPVSSALSSPGDVSFGTGGSEAFGLGDSTEPELIEFDPTLDVGTPDSVPVVSLDGDAFALRDDVATPTPAEPVAQVVPDPVPEEPVRAPRRTMRPTMSVLAQSVDLLRDRVSGDSRNWQAHRELGEALLEDGDRQGGIDELEKAMLGFERDEDFDSARSVADSIIRLNPLSVRHHQRRVEYAFRMNDRPRLIEAYVELADALFREGQADKSKVVYERVLELAPDDARALAALSAFVDKPRRSSGAIRMPEAPSRASRRSVALSAADAPSTPRSSTAVRRSSSLVTPQEPEPQAPAVVERAAAAAPEPAVADTPAPEVVSDSRAQEVARAAAHDAEIDAAFDFAERTSSAASAAPATPAPPEPSAPEPAPPETPAARPDRTTSSPQIAIRETPVSSKRVTPPAVVRDTPSDDFVDLEDWLKEEDLPKSTRMVVEEKAPSGDEMADFNDMLRKFKQGVARNVEDEDHESHYDLGIAYKEMGLVEEAIAEFQKALRGPKNRVRTYEALGQCFVEKGQPQVAIAILQRALVEPGAADDQLIGVLYLLGQSSEAVNQRADAVKYYQRVFAVDINFRDVRARMRELEQAGK